MIRRLYVALLLLIAIGGDLAAQTAIHQVALVVQPSEEAAAVAKAVAAKYGARLEAPVAPDQTVAMTVDASVLELLARDPRVRAVDSAPGDEPVAPPHVVPAATAAPRRLMTEGTATPWKTGTYTYDAAGNVTVIGSDQFTYDSYSRVTRGTAGGHTQEFAYDRWGNLTSIKTDATTIPLTVDAATNRLSAVNGVAVLYDAAGQVDELDNLAFYDYDGSGMLVSSGSSETSPSNVYLYTPSDERIASVDLQNNAEVRSTWTFRDPAGKVLRRFEKEYVSSQWSWVWRQDYIYYGSQMLAAEKDTAPKTLHYFPDHLGTPRLTTDQGGMQVAVNAYLPFGAPATAMGVHDAKKFTGHERDASGLDYMHARYYSAAWGRFLSVDPAWESAGPGKPQSWNRYSYVLNNPINYTDPDGRVCSAAVIDCVLTGGSIAGPLGAGIGIVVGGAIVYGASNVDWRAVGEWFASAGGSSGEMAAERMVQSWAQQEQVKQDSAQNTNGTLPKPPTGAGSVPPEDRDPRRKFSPQEREAKRDAQGGQCANGCGEAVDKSNSNGHHVVRHADGGKTDDKNHAEVCIDCHKELHSSPPM